MDKVTHVDAEPREGPEAGVAADARRRGRRGRGSGGRQRERAGGRRGDPFDAHYVTRM